MTVTLDWTIVAGLLAWTALAFWLGRKTGDSGSRDLSDPPPVMPAPRPPAMQARASVAIPDAARLGLCPDQIEAILAELSRGNKILAIKLFREATGLGLAEAKQAVEAMEG